MSDDQLGPWMINPKNTEGRYLVFDNLYNEMRLIGGVAKVEPSDHICLTHHRCAGVTIPYCHAGAWDKADDCMMVDVVRIPKEDS